MDDSSAHAVRASNLERVREHAAPASPRDELRRLVTSHEKVLGELAGNFDDPAYREWWLSQAHGTLGRLREEIDRL